MLADTNKSTVAAFYTELDGWMQNTAAADATTLDYLTGSGAVPTDSTPPYTPPSDTAA